MLVCRIRAGRDVTLILTFVHVIQHLAQGAVVLVEVESREGGTLAHVDQVLPDVLFVDLGL